MTRAKKFGYLWLSLLASLSRLGCGVAQTGSTAPGSGVDGVEEEHDSALADSTELESGPDGEEAEDDSALADSTEPVSVVSTVANSATISSWTSEPVLDWDPREDCRAARVSVGANHACALTEGAHLYCWGANWAHQLGQLKSPQSCGLWDTPCNHTPQAVGGIADVAQVAMGIAHTCAATHAGELHCWGSDISGNLGVRTEGICQNPFATQPDHPREYGCTPYPTLVPTVSHVSGLDAWGFSCVQHGADGLVSCWGGEGLDVPTRVEGVFVAREVDHLCALTGDRVMECWDRVRHAATYEWVSPLQVCPTGTTPSAPSTRLSASRVPVSTGPGATGRAPVWRTRPARWRWWMTWGTPHKSPWGLAEVSS